jgi:hypothetical protein
VLDGDAVGRVTVPMGAALVISDDGGFHRALLLLADTNTRLPPPARSRPSDLDHGGVQP